MHVIGKFAYNAEVIPKGSRKPRRTVLFAPIEYDIAEPSRSDVTKGALRAESQFGVHFHGGDRISLPGWNGRLWLEKLADRPRQLAAELANPRPWGPHRNPVEASYDASSGPRPQQDYDIAAQSEENFVGEILWTDKAGMHARAQAAAQNLAIIDGKAHEAVREPVWRVMRLGGPQWTIRPMAADDSFDALNDHLFRPDRFDDAVEWVRRIAGPDADIEVYGSIRRALPEFLSRDDLTNFVATRLRRLVVSETFVEMLPYLPPEGIAIWQRLGRLHDRMPPRPEGAEAYVCDLTLPDGADALATARDVEACYAMASEAEGLPLRRRQRIDGLAADFLRPFSARVAFELERRPAPALAEQDDAAIAALAAGGPR